jgi:aconitate hydratase
MRSADSFQTRATLKIDGQANIYFSLEKLARQLDIEIKRLPLSIRILLENLLRNEDGHRVTRGHIETLAGWVPDRKKQKEIPFLPARVLMQDFTGVPALVDLAAMREAIFRQGGNPDHINPRIPVHLIIDHSVQVDAYGSRSALALNAKREMERNHERYAFLKWGQTVFDNFLVVPPATGICHQVNLEYLARVVMTEQQGRETLIYPDTLIGLDSHSTMINGLGVLGWGVGGIEAEAAMLGRPVYFLPPRVIGFELTGHLAEGVTATDLVLTITQMTREKGVVGDFIEFYGSGLGGLSLPDRATIANMTPEFGATISLFPVDEKTLDYLLLTGRSEQQVELVLAYCSVQGLFHTPAKPLPLYSDTLLLDLATVEPCLAGPKRPHDRIPVSGLKKSFSHIFEKEISAAPDQSVSISRLDHGAVVIAAITSCTNTSNPAVLIGAGLLAQNAVKRGLKVKPWVKTSLAPGSTVVTEYLQKAGLLPDMEALGFHPVAYGCTTCIGNSGPLDPEIARQVNEWGLVAAAVLSGNRNYEGRVHSLTRANYLASPMLVIAHALAGTVDIDFENEPLGRDQDNRPVFLRDIRPTRDEINALMSCLTPDLFSERYQDVFHGDDNWRNLPDIHQDRYEWAAGSTYIKEPPFLTDLTLSVSEPEDIVSARVLALLDDSVTTDHISPAGAIPEDSPAGQYLLSQGVSPRDFNSYGARRGNHEVMVRGTFGNVRLRNRLVPEKEGGWTTFLPTNEVMSIYDAAMAYRKDHIPLIVLAGKDYGSGSSRDWAAKGTRLLGVRAVIAESFERIHRGNLVAMGVLPLQFQPGMCAENLGLTGREFFSITGLSNELAPGKTLSVRAAENEIDFITFEVITRLDSAVEVDYYRHGGILPYVLRQLLESPNP